MPAMTATVDDTHSRHLPHVRGSELGYCVWEAADSRFFRPDLGPENPLRG